MQVGFPVRTHFLEFLSQIFLVRINKRAWRTLGRSPEEKVKGHNGSITEDSNVVHQILVEDLEMKLYTKYESSGSCSFR